TNTDKDAFKINLPKNGLIKIAANPYSVGPDNEGADLDMEVALLNSDMNVVKVYSPQDKLDVSIDTTLMAGDYFLVVKGSGNANTSNYGSLGSYRLAGTYSPLSVTPISQVLLSGEVEKNKHELKWSIIADEAIKSLMLESSSDGAIFNTLTNLSNADKSFSYEPLLNENIFYRLKVISVTGQESYSNIVPLKSATGKKGLIHITSTVTSDITITAPQNYQYQLADMGGRIIKTGKSEAGVSNINIKNSPNGIYILQIICNSQKTTQRILKL
ncbi:MAG: T9SS type A sorting domain-containing protein, partial [Ginsengibacter sp.]